MQNDSYQLGESVYKLIGEEPPSWRDNPDWGQFSHRQRKKLEAERVKHGQTVGIIDSEGNPLPRSGPKIPA